LQELRLWVFAILISAYRGDGHKPFYIAEMIAAIEQFGLSSWVETVQVLKGIAWVDAFPTEELEFLLKSRQRN